MSWVYCGASSTCKLKRWGENWYRGNDLRDGPLWKFPRVIWDIIQYEFGFGRWKRYNIDEVCVKQAAEFLDKTALKFCDASPGVDPRLKKIRLTAESNHESLKNHFDDTKNIFPTKDWSAI